jgi:methylmalonyl-CoA mutase
VPDQDEPLALAADFPQTTADQWRASVDAVLARGRGELSQEQLDRLFQRTLTTTTEDGIVIQPLYTAEDWAAPASLPGQAPFVRGSTASGPVPSGWDVRQKVSLASPEANRTALTELENGATSLWLDIGDQDVSTDLLDAALAGVYLELVPVVLQPGAQAVPATAALQQLWERRGLAPEEVRATLGLDPIGRAAVTGGTDVDADFDAGLARAAATARDVAARYPQVRTLVVDTTPYHNAGATEADELALALATGVAYLRALVGAGLDVDAALRQLEFRLAATDDQFLTMASFRAARRLWARVAEASGASGESAGQRQHAVTSLAMLTRYDPWVNLLRTTVAAFAAGLGGADAVTVEPYDLLLHPPAGALDRGRRLARNTQTILLEESHLGRVIDPAGGSWFVEHLTDDLARRAWPRFQQIEAAGGMAAAWRSGLVRSWLDEATAARRAQVAHRRRPITGVSEFPLTDESPPPADTGPAGGLPVRRYAEPFEQLRDRAGRHQAETGQPPRVFLATLGPLAEHTARAGFCINLFAAGGVRAVQPGTVTAESAAEAFVASGAPLACVVGSNARYASEAAATARALAAAGPSRLYLAGDPGELRAALDEAGVAEYVVAGGDAVDLLERALDAAGVAR